MPKSLFSRRPLNPHHWYTADHRLLFQCIVDSQAEDHIKLGQKWKKLDHLHDSLYGVSGVLPLLYHRLQESGVDSPLKERLAGVYRRNWASNQVSISQAKTISASLAQHQIRHAFAGDLALAYQLYQPIHTRPIWLMRLIVDDAELSQVTQIIETDLSDRQFRSQKPRYLRGGRGFVAGKNPMIVVNNGIMACDDLSAWETKSIHDLAVLDCPALLIRTVAQTVGQIPHVHQMIEILNALNKLNSDEKQELIEVSHHAGLSFPLWQILVFLVDVLAMNQHQALAEQLSQHKSYLQYGWHRIKQRIC